MGLVKGEDTITWQEWCDSPAVGKFTRYNRRHVLNLWAKANQGRDSPAGLSLGQFLLWVMVGSAFVMLADFVFLIEWGY